MEFRINQRCVGDGHLAEYRMLDFCERPSCSDVEMVKCLPGIKNRRTGNAPLRSSGTAPNACTGCPGLGMCKIKDGDALK